jgi:hypothetical protein
MKERLLKYSTHILAALTADNEVQLKDFLEPMRLLKIIDTTLYFEMVDKYQNQYDSGSTFP